MTNTNTYNSKYKNFYVLGDSLSDSGAMIEILDILSVYNLYPHWCLFPLWNLHPFKGIKFAEHFYQGRSFTNGPVAVEHVAQHLDLGKFKPGWKFNGHEQIGQNYAVSNATASKISGDEMYEKLFNEFSLVNQLNALITHHPDISEKDLFLVMIGGNDVMQAAICQDIARKEEILEKAVSEICSTLGTLNEHGVKHIVVADVPDIGLIPAFNKSGEAKASATESTKNFNIKLENGLKDIERKYTNLEIKKLYFNAKVKNMINEYEKNGLNYQDACISDIADKKLEPYDMIKILLFRQNLPFKYNPGCSEGTLKDHFFFDYFHPTEGLHEQLGNEIYNLIVT